MNEIELPLVGVPPEIDKQFEDQSERLRHSWPILLEPCGGGRESALGRVSEPLLLNPRSLRDSASLNNAEEHGGRWKRCGCLDHASQTTHQPNVTVCDIASSRHRSWTRIPPLPGGLQGKNCTKQNFVNGALERKGSLLHYRLRNPATHAGRPATTDFKL
jgi:hypothetical protein